MIRLVFSALPLVMAISFVGCGESRPDPRENPDFDEEVLNDPGKVEMKPIEQ
jgi:hypothetical protein